MSSFAQKSSGAAANGNGTNGAGNGENNSNRARCHTDSLLLLHNLSTASHDLDTVGAADSSLSVHPHKQRLYELFSLIEKEMDALHLENCALRAQLELGGPISSQRGERAKPLSADETPIRRNFGGDGANYLPATNSAISKKVSQSRQQKWRSAFKNPSGKLVALKVGANFPESKHKFVQSFKGHTDGVWHVCGAQVGALASSSVVASAGADHSSKIWLADRGSNPLASYAGHKGSVNSVSIRPDTNTARPYTTVLYSKQLTLLTTSGDRTAHIWRVNLEELLERRREKENDETVQQIHQPLLRLVGHSDAVMAGDWLIGGDQLITASWDRTANLFDAESGKALKVLSGHDRELTSCSAHPSQKLVATASKDYTFRLWDFRDPIHSVAVFQGHNDSVSSVVFSTLHHIVSGSDDRTVKVWDLRNMRSPTSANRLDSAPNRISICTTRNLLAIPLDNRNISVYDLHGNRQARIPRSAGKCHHRSVNACAWMNDHPLNNLVSCGFDKQIIGWRVHLPQSAGART